MVKKCLFILTTLLIIFVSTPALSIRETVVFQDDFESKKIQKWNKEFCCQHSIAFVTTPRKQTRKGNTSIKFILKKDDPNLNLGKRSEIALKSVPRNSEYIYGFSFFLPKTYQFDSSFEILAQWHGLPDFDLKETWRSPPLALLTQNGNFKLARSWDINPVTENSQRESEIVNLGKYPTGEWIDWVFHVKWSDRADGLIEMWKNEHLVFKKLGANTYNDKKGTYFKIGIYKPDWKHDPEKSITKFRSIFYDDVLISKIE